MPGTALSWKWVRGTIIAVAPTALLACEFISPAAVGTPTPPTTNTSNPSATSEVATEPPARWDAAAAFDPSSGEFVLFGGHRGSTLLADTWVHDARSWKQVLGQPHPSARFSAAAAEDPMHHNLVLFGGYGGESLGDTWVWAAHTWTLMHPTSSPSPRFGHAMAYDSVRGQVILYGGQAGPNSVLNDIWAWDGANWSQLNITGGPTAGKVSAALAFDVRAGELVLTGVTPDSDLSTWTLIGTNWTRHPASSGDQPWANDQPAAYLPTYGKVVLLVAGPRATDPPSELLTWDGSSWSAVSAATLPPPRVGAAFAFCPNFGRLLLFGGTAVTVTQNSMTYGDALSDTWSWDGHKWTQLG
ncbi:MAG: Kelch repeat-containing protein [Candidatus Dormibacteraceae bacterium]